MPTIKDVAQRAGVSVTTVSRILNSRGYISDSIREKVHGVMKDLNYQPNEIARSLYRRKSNIIGLIIPTVTHPFFSELTSYIENFAHDNEYRILLCNSHMDSKKEREYIGMLRRNQVDGIIMGSHTLEVDEYVNLNLPLVTFDRSISDDIPYISCDNYQGGELATNLLIDKGCKKIAHISGNLCLDMLSNKRYQAFVDVASQRGVEYFSTETDIDVFNSDQYEMLMYNLFETHPDIDGIFSSGDFIAAYAIKVCHQLGRKIPEDIKIVGFDDVNISSIVYPGITTVKQPIKEMGKLAIDLICMQISGEQVTHENVLGVTLVERGTV